MCLWSRVSNCKWGSPCVTVCLGWWVCPCVHTCVVILGEALVSPPAQLLTEAPLSSVLTGSLFLPWGYLEPSLPPSPGLSQPRTS